MEHRPTVHLCREELRHFPHSVLCEIKIRRSSPVKHTGCQHERNARLQNTHTCSAFMPGLFTFLHVAARGSGCHFKLGELLQ